MAQHVTYTRARANLAQLCNQVASNREVVVIRRRGADDVALIAGDELASLVETAYLLRSPKNAERLLRAIRRAQARTLKPEPLDKLRSELGLDRP